MSRYPWLTLDRSAGSSAQAPQDRLRGAKARRAEQIEAEARKYDNENKEPGLTENDVEDMEPGLEKKNDDEDEETGLKKNDDDADMGPVVGPPPSGEPALGPAADFDGVPASATPTVEVATMDDLNRRFGSMGVRFERLFGRSTELFIQHSDDSTKKLNEKIDEVARVQEKFMKELQQQQQQQQADTSAKFESLTARLSALRRTSCRGSGAGLGPPAERSQRSPRQEGGGCSPRIPGLTRTLGRTTASAAKRRERLKHGLRPTGCLSANARPSRLQRAPPHPRRISIPRSSSHNPCSLREGAFSDAPRSR